jgi:hypothetical protein
MGLLEPTHVTCGRCKQPFACGCVLKNVCDKCQQAECVHDFVTMESESLSGPGERHETFCRKCWMKKDGKTS